MWLEYLNQKNGDDVAWMVEKPFVVLLSLKHIDQVSALQRDTRNVHDLIFSLLLMIWRVRNFELCLISLIVNLHETEFREAVLKTNSVESDASDLDPHCRLPRPSCVDVLKVLLFYDKLFHSFLHMSHPLRRLLLSQFRYFEWPQNGCHGDSEWI